MRNTYYVFVCLILLTFVRFANATESPYLSMISDNNKNDRECWENYRRHKNLMHYTTEINEIHTIKKKSYAISLGLTSIPILGPLPSRIYMANKDDKDDMRKIIMKGMIFGAAELFCVGMFLAYVYPSHDRKTERSGDPPKN